MNVGNVNKSVGSSNAIASSKLATVAVGNVNVNGASAGASAQVSGPGVKFGNVNISCPSAEVAVGLDAGLAVGNVCLGGGLGINLIPNPMNLLNLALGGSGGGKSGDGGDADGGSNKSGGGGKKPGINTAKLFCHHYM